MTQNSRSPEFQEALRVAVEYHTRDINVSLPGRIEKYDEKTQKADVKPLVKRRTPTMEGGELVESLQVIPSVPVRFLTAGGFFCSVPVKKGDYCQLIFCSYSIDKYMSGNGQDTDPEDSAMHEFDGAVAVMGLAPFSKAIQGVDKDNMVLGKSGGPQIQISDSKIELGEKNAADQVPLESKIQSELSGIKAVLDALLAHTHPSIGAPPALIPPTITYSPSPTNSNLVTIKE